MNVVLKIKKIKIDMPDMQAQPPFKRVVDELGHDFPKPLKK